MGRLDEPVFTRVLDTQMFVMADGWVHAGKIVAAGAWRVRVTRVRGRLLDIRIRSPSDCSSASMWLSQKRCAK